MFNLSEMKIIHDALLTLLILDEEQGGEESRAEEIEKALVKSTGYVMEMSK